MAKKASPSKTKKYAAQFAVTEQNKIRKQKKHMKFMEKKALKNNKNK